MWVRKSDTQILQECRASRLSLRAPLVWFLVALMAAIASVFSPRNAEGYWPRSWPVFLFRAMLIAVIVAGIVYVLQLLRYKKSADVGVGAAQEAISMWMRKDNKIVARERRRVWLCFRGPVLLFVICFLADFVLGIQGPRQSVAGTHWPDTFSKILRDAVCIATIVAVAGYALQIVFRRKLDPLAIHAKVVICDTCHRVKHRDGDGNCECGGMFDDFDNWTWVEEK
jgi:hypothetical protein